MENWLLIIAVFLVLFLVYHIFLRRYWERKIKEKSRIIKETEAQLIHMEKMASIGTLAAGIAHEINNPLSFLISNLEILRDCIQNLEGGPPVLKCKNISGDEVLKIIEESVDGASRIKRIVSDLRIFSKRDDRHRALLDINQVLESVMTILWNEMKHKASLAKDYQVKTSISGDSMQLSQVFLNIILNSIQAITAKGVVALSTYEDEKNVYIKISDTGCGIPQDTLARIFEPFFSTKKSTGLGLFISYNIIKQHDGDIKVESKTGKGTTFIVRLPR